MSRKLQKIGFALAALFIVTSSLLSFGLNYFKHHQHWVIAVTAIWTIAFTYFMVGHRWRTADGSRLKLLKFRDTLHDIPKRGLLWVGIGILVTALFWYLQLYKYAGVMLKDVFDSQINPYLFFFLLGLAATFLSEFITNTGVHVIMFLGLFPMLKHHLNLSWEGMLIIALCSTCAFMTPLSTPSNGLGFGSSSKISIRHLLGAGFLMNVACALVISLWVKLVIPLSNSLLLH